MKMKASTDTFVLELALIKMYLLMTPGASIDWNEILTSNYEYLRLPTTLRIFANLTGHLEHWRDVTTPSPYFYWLIQIHIWELIFVINQWHFVNNCYKISYITFQISNRNKIMTYGGTKILFKFSYFALR